MTESMKIKMTIRMMKSIVHILALTIVLTSNANAEEERTTPEIWGQWATVGYGAVVDIYPCKDTKIETLCGDLAWVWDPANVDAETIRSLMLWGFEYKDNAWSGGRLKNPEDGKTYKGKITLRSADLLDLKGCAGPFCKTQTWRRLESLPHAKISNPGHMSEP